MKKLDFDHTYKDEAAELLNIKPSDQWPEVMARVIIVIKDLDERLMKLEEKK